MTHITGPESEIFDEQLYDKEHYDDRYPQGAALEVAPEDPRELTPAQNTRYLEALRAISRGEPLEGN